MKSIPDSLQNDKLPGNDGMPIEFYITCWNLISDFLMMCAGDLQMWRNIQLTKKSSYHLRNKAGNEHLQKIGDQYLLSTLTQKSFRK